ncbi:MAG: hypothetical protein ACLQT7_04470 [Candidatus Dormibacteria bacterium]
MTDAAERQAFAERMRLQLESRYRGLDVTIDGAAFALRLHGAGVDVTLPLAPLHHACLRQPGRSGSLIADFVRGTERQLSPRTGTEVSPAHLLWCVRGVRYLEGLHRSGELVTRPLGAAMVAFVAEELPGPAMRGVPAAELREAGLDEADARSRADANTAERFATLPERIRGAARVPADGWRLGSDTLFQGSVLLAAPVLAAFAERAGGEVLLAVPDRAEVLALPAALPSAARFRMRVVRAWREAMNPVSRGVLVTDGASLTELGRQPRGSGSGLELLGWLRG